MGCVARAYNNATQTVTADANALTLLGTSVVDNTGAIAINTSSFTVKAGGVYHLSADVTFTPTSTASASTVKVYWSDNGETFPCTVSTTSTSGVVTIHSESDVPLGVCCMIKPNLVVNIEGAAGTVTHVSAAVSR